MKIYEYDAVIEKHPNLNSTFVNFPFDVEKEFGTKGQVKVKATFDKVDYRGSLARMKSTTHGLGITQAIRKKLGKVAGETVHVKILRDTDERIVEIPDELKTAFEKHLKAAEFYNTLSFTNQKEYAQWISSAKKEKTKTSRLSQTIDRLNQGVKHP